MKKILFTMLCCTVFFVGCNNATQAPSAESQEVTTNVEVSTDTVAVSTDAVVASTQVVVTEQPSQK